MEVRCEECGHIGQPASVEQREGRLALICAFCQHPNALDVGQQPEPPQPETEPPQDEPSTTTNPPAPAAAAPVAAAPPTTRPAASLLDLERLIPEPGPGPRCRKCVKLLDPHQTSCSRCGLSVAEAERYSPGEAPFEQPPAGREEAHEQAVLLWESASQRLEPQDLDTFVALILEHDLAELGIRTLRRHLVDHPDDDVAKEQLRRIAESYQGRALQAAVHIRRQGQDLDRRARAVKSFSIGVTVVFLLAVLGLFLSRLAPGGC